MILIVEDSPDQQRLVRQMLESSGYRDLLFAESAPQGMQLLLAHADSVDLILADVWLPSGNGIQFTRDIRSMPQFRDIPVIIMTGKEGPQILPQAMDAGVNDFIFKPFHWLELVARVRNSLRLRTEIARRISREAELLEGQRQLEGMLSKLEVTSNLDPLTAVANRRKFDEHLDREWKRGARAGFVISMILLDIDFFKEYNSLYGHPGGDQCLKRMALGVRDVARRPTDLFARYGGEEFAIILPETPGPGAAHVAEIVRKAVEGLRIDHEGAPGKIVTASIGVASLLPARDASPEILVKAADRALYRAKQEGRNCFAVFDVEKDGAI
ncbi:MAG: diguanylate cyclase [Leptospirales bacterium]|nr:diguanylate cyclase [Leptospirales bacterium]